MSVIRPPAVAGLFYPGDARTLDETVSGYLVSALDDRRSADVNRPAPKALPKALIAPHAGYVYSGAAAARAYARLAPVRDRIARVVLLGPAHRVPLRGLATTSAECWTTPLGRIEIDRAAIAAVADLLQVSVNDTAHAQEHSLEVQLPFLQKLLPGFALVPFVVGSATNEQVSEVLETLWGGPETLIVISSDLSHYLPYEQAQEIDGSTAEAIERLDWSAIGQDRACGRIPISGLLTCAQARGMAVERVALCNSGDTAGSKDRVVGYGAWVFG